MNKIIATIATLFILAFGLNASAAETANPLKDVNATKIALTYVEAITIGNTEFNKHLFTSDFEYRNATSEQVSSRSEYLAFLKANKGLKYNCKTTYEILDQAGTTSVAKATMQFEKFTRVDYITMVQTVDGWKVSKVVTTYP
ncbi:Putative lumazine-binding [Sphingobacterium nematocida]|uniref:Putative lumazine-binding n=1 Tax=Sphingobacterium nematocida TaxID=1513896 RepID=A0A1T5FZU3_9SPHI|nr:nuclear transport factor 2 family protein [Sphingobacterium nematocida]SKC01630.1 Putative lumazine-binding [Sphingobacterium nematocida]